MSRWRAMVAEYRRLRGMSGGALYDRLEALGLAISSIERERRFDRR